MDIFEGIEGRFNSLRSELKSVDVPEWDSKIYYYDVPPTGDALKILKYVTPDGGFELEGIVTALMLTARKDDGSRMFFDHHKDLLMTKTEVGIILRVVKDMGVMDHIVGGIEEEKKN